MLQEVLLNSKRHLSFRLFFLLGLCWAVMGCSLFDAKQDSSQSLVVNKGAIQRVFFAPYDQVWRAAHTIVRYPIAGENQDTGSLETETVKITDGWLPPDSAKAPSQGVRYKLYMTFAKGRIEGRESTRLTIEKKIEKQKDFFSEPEQIDSDGLEEKVIFYRIERELIINETLRRAALNP